ncbi:MAG: hypothetical protein HOJ54_11115, partial [Phycisphaerae bacterium]|nr:hypothetical protein [Phycisphaerae bacterium]
MTMQHARFTLISLCVSMTLGGFAAAADDAPTTTQTVQQSIAPTVPLTRRAVQERLAELKKIALEAAKALPEGETKVLRAVVMEMAGKVQWRQESTGKWKLAAKDDILKPGAMIRTGLRSWMMLRIGINANVLIDSGSRISLPQIVQAGDTLRTAVQVKRGRADVEVGHVGLTNDFSVLTPSGALAVRGTGLAVAHNALQGTQVFGARTNAMNAIAMKYYGSKVANMLSGEAVSTQAAPNPAVAAALDTVGPSPLNASEAQDQQDAPDQTSQAVSNSDPINGAVRELLAEQQEAINDEILEEEFGEHVILEEILEEIIEEEILEEIIEEEILEEIIEEEFGDPFLQDGFAWYVGPGGAVLPEDRGAVATGLYWDMKLQYVPHHVDPYNADGHRIASVFEHDLFASTGFYDPEREQFIHGSAEQGY